MSKFIVEYQQVIRRDEEKGRKYMKDHWGGELRYDTKEEAMDAHKRSHGPTRVIEVVKEDEQHNGWVKQDE